MCVNRDHPALTTTSDTISELRCSETDEYGMLGVAIFTFGFPAFRKRMAVADFVD